MFFELISKSRDFRSRGLLDSARSAITEAKSLSPQHGALFTEEQFLQLQEYGLSAGHRGYISCKSLGSYGRFGNQVCQYFVLRALSLKLNLLPIAPPWLGNYLFTIPHVGIPGVDLQPIEDSLIRQIFSGSLDAINFDISSSLALVDEVRPWRQILTNDFTLHPQLGFLERELRSLVGASDVSVSAHLRLGDLFQEGEQRTSEAERFLTEIRKLKIGGTVFLATDSPDALIPLKLTDYGNIVLAQEMYDRPNLSWFYDWCLLRVSKLRILNVFSSFSFTSDFLGAFDSITLTLDNDYQRKF